MQQTGSRIASCLLFQGRVKGLFSKLCRDFFKQSIHAIVFQRAVIADSLYSINKSMIFSKPDWHSDAYWHHAFGPAPTRNVNYSIKEEPQLWDSFVDYTHRQLEELGTRYGKIDCLWLDGGWVNKDNLEQDIRLGEIVEKLRKGPQPHLIVCDRTVGGIYENIVTPEKQVPEEPLLSHGKPVPLSAKSFPSIIRIRSSQAGNWCTCSWMWYPKAAIWL